MATADLITELNTDLNNAYTSIANKGGTVPENKNMANLPDSVDSIPTGSGGEDEPYVPFVPEFDGGEWGTIAYLDSNNEVQYYSCPSNPMSLLAPLNGIGSSSKIFYTLENGEEITNFNVVAFAFGSHTTSISAHFLNSCYELRNLYFGNTVITKLGDYFLNNCYAFNQPLTIPDTVTSIGAYFLTNCYAFNQPLTIPDTVTSIGNYFLNNCYVFNQPLTIPDTVTSIGNYFLNNCYVFNQPISLPEIASIGAYFLSACHVFNQPLTIPDTVTSIGNYFLNNCYVFNQPLTIPDTVTSIGNSFLSACHAFNQPLTIPDTVTSIGTYFLSAMGMMKETITIETNATVTDINTLSTSANTVPAYTTGITLAGSGAAAWKEALPNRISTPYRKLILEEETN